MREGDDVYKNTVTPKGMVAADLKQFVLLAFDRLPEDARAPTDTDEAIAVVDAYLSSVPSPAQVSGVSGEQENEVNMRTLVDTMRFDRDFVLLEDRRTAAALRDEGLDVGQAKGVTRGWKLLTVFGQKVTPEMRICDSETGWCWLNGAALAPDMSLDALMTFHARNPTASLKRQSARAYHHLHSRGLSFRYAEGASAAERLREAKEVVRGAVADAQQDAEDSSNALRADFDSVRQQVENLLQEVRESYRRNLPDKTVETDELLRDFNIGVNHGGVFTFEPSPTGSTETGRGFFQPAYGDLLPLIRGLPGAADFLKLAIGHEIGHNFEGLDRDSFPTLVAVRERVDATWGEHLFHGGAEIWGDWLAAGMVLADMEKDEVVRALQPFCEEEGDMEHHGMHERVLLMAKHPSVYPKFCASRPAPVVGSASARCHPGCGPFRMGCADLDEGDEEWCSFAQAV